MALLIAPYNNGMRIGQGFNSYTQQICIDDAVVIDPERAENIVTNDGTTMRTLAEAAGNPSAWTRIREVLPDPSVSTSAQHQTTTAQARDDVAPGFNPKDALATATTSKAVGDAASKYQDAYTDEQMAKMRGPDVDFDTKTGLGKNQGVSELTGYGNKSVGQTVIHTSRFVEKLSEVTDDMNITGALSIKASMFGGSGRGAYIDTNKFEQSDLNFYISVKVINQSVNFKDALKYQPVDSVDKTNFVDVFGDTFISGFLEGGEFNALVSMKILNSAKKNVIAAEAKVALSVPVVQVTAEGRVNIAKSNINTNAETTIQVSWSGGGHIKDANEQWDVDSLIRAASRFPDLVAISPQRIYAILTKYDSLRSFIELKPPNATPLDYENAKLYTNSLMDSYMTYKSLYQESGTAIFDVQSGAKRFISPIAGASSIPASQDDFDLTPFPPTLVGLDQARREIRRQMSLIVKEVKLLTNNPTLASDPTHKEPSQSPVSFQTRLPKVEVPRIMSSTPLSGQEIVPDPVVEDPGAPELFTRGGDLEGNLTADETTKTNSLTVKQPSLSRVIRMTAPVGDFSAGSQFCFLDYLHEDCLIHALKIEFSGGACTALTTTYTNGLVVVRGASSPLSTAFEISNFSGDHLIAGSIEVGTPAAGADTATCVTSIKLYTNRGRSLIATAQENRIITDTSARRDGVEYSGLGATSWDSPLISGFIKGFWGRSNEKRGNGKIYRLGFFWGDVVPADVGSLPFDENLQYPATSGPVEITGTWGSGPDQKNVHVAFSSPLPETPQIIWGIKCMEAKIDTTVTPYGYPRARLQLSDLTPAGCNFSLAALSGTADPVSGSTAGFAANYLTLPKNGLRFDTGKFDTSILGSRSSGAEYVRQYIPFSRNFTSPPVVRCWFTAFDMTLVGVPATDRQITLGVAQRTSDGFTLTIQTTNGYGSASIGWLAYDSEENGKRVRSDQYAIDASNTDKKAIVECSFSDRPFARVPATFVGCHSFNVRQGNWVRWRAQQIEVTKEKFRFECGSANTNGVVTLGFVWIAME